MYIIRRSPGSHSTIFPYHDTVVGLASVPARFTARARSIITNLGSYFERRTNNVRSLEVRTVRARITFDNIRNCRRRIAYVWYNFRWRVSV